MNSVQHLAEDLHRIVTRSRQIGWVSWFVAAFVMVYGTPIVYQLATQHGIPPGVAWMLSLAADGALCVGLIATPVLASLGISAGWVGTLRWVSGATTWGLQTGSSWIRPGGPDVVGVGVHTAGPLLLFFVVEAASYFQRKVASVIIQKARELESAEQRDAERRARLAELEAGLRSATAEVSARTVERDSHRRDLERLTAETERLRSALGAAEVQHAETLRELRRQHAERLAAARAETRAGSLRSKTHPVSAKPAPRPRMTDEEAVEFLLNTNGGLDREWSQKAIVAELGVGFGRAPRLLEAVTAEQARRGSETPYEPAISLPVPAPAEPVLAANGTTTSKGN